MTGPGMSKEVYEKMPLYAKVFYWSAVFLLVTAIIYFWLVKMRVF